MSGPSSSATPATNPTSAIRDDPPGINRAGVTQWLVEHAAAVPPLTFAAIAGGHSNLTYSVTDRTGQRFVVRRPPLAQRLVSAHDMGREHRIISALGASSVPVPKAIGLCDDPKVNSDPFYAMHFVNGHVVRDRDIAERTLSVAARRAASESLVDTLAALHAVEPAAVGLATLGKHDGYIERQLNRWYGQWNQQRTRQLPDVDLAYRLLSERIPEQGPATIVHGDYRLDNCIIGDDGAVRAVLDWEICTLGDPLADLGLLVVYWTGPDDPPSAWGGSATTASGFYNRQQLAERYQQATTRTLDSLSFYVAFAYWKLACILEGVYARYLGGALGERTLEELAPFERQVVAAAAMAVAELERS
jgi:aminoglycoside phosphotransferase (APT) family kinase protein